MRDDWHVPGGRANASSALRIGHIVNLFSAAADSEHGIAQAVTVKTMMTARDFAAPHVAVELFSAQYAKDVGGVPAGFIRTRDLDRSVLDVGEFTIKRELPLLRDITDRLYEASAADVLIYTNADIALMPSFYDVVASLIADGFDAFTINRRTIPRIPPDRLPLMYAEAGAPHPGHDCFVFARSTYPNFSLGNVCLGVGYVGLTLYANLAFWGNSFRCFDDLHVTFHLGDDLSWREPEFDDYLHYNRREFKLALGKLDADRLKELGVVDPLSDSHLDEARFGPQSDRRGRGLFGKLTGRDLVSTRKGRRQRPV
jgi:hypothetical protein